MSVTPISRYAQQRRREDTAYARTHLDRLISDLGDDGLYGRLQTLIGELKADGLGDALFHALQALPALKQAETALERAKGKCS